MRIRSQLILMAGMLCWIIPLAGQIRLHDVQRDAAAQDAKKLADQLGAGELFLKQTANLNVLTEKDAATVVADAKEEMTSWINSFNSWSDVEALRGLVNSKSHREDKGDASAEKEQLKQQANALNAEIAKIRSAAAGSSDSVDRLAKVVGQFQSALDFANEQVGKDQTAVTTTISVLNQLQTLYKSYSQQMQAVNSAAAKLKGLQTNLKQALLARLKVEEDYLVAQAQLYQRRERELEPVRTLLNVCHVPEGAAWTDHITETLEKLASDQEQLSKASRSLLACTSLAAEGNLPDRLFRLRLAELEHLRSIQLSAANARVYEAVLAGGVQRLALFYQGGVKPETLAQIVQALSTAGIFGKLLTQ